jgi:tripartite-type tricarboxylate transporter receptor subunit TctC
MRIEMLRPIIAAAALLMVASVAPAQDAGFKPIRWLVPYPAGGGTDVVARAIGQQMSTLTGHSVVIENKPGAATAIAAQDTARSAPDGATVLSGDNGTCSPASR